MHFVAERILPDYLAALDQALADAARRLPAGRLRRVLMRLRRRLGHRGEPAARFAALDRLALIGEAQGWLTVEEAIILRKLGYRVAFLERRCSGPGAVREKADDWLEAWRGRRATPAVGPLPAPDGPRHFIGPRGLGASSSSSAEPQRPLPHASAGRSLP